MTANERPEPTDVCLILEGTYPYVRGGVSTWVHDLIRGLPGVTFSLLSISADRRSPQAFRYQIPSNVRAFAEVFVHELVADTGRRCPARERNAAWDTVRRFHLAEGRDRVALAGELLDVFTHPDRSALGVTDAMFSREAWEFVVDRYHQSADGTSFIDWFWTWRAVHAPVMQTLVAEIPPARVYHAISTGYAGLLGTLAKRRSGRPFLITEHGIYVRERMIDIARAEWIHEEPVRVKVARPGANPLKEMWTNLFRMLGQLAYESADEIVTLFGGNQTLQHELGADPRKTRVIPNGVDVGVYAPLYERRTPEASRPPRVGFVGRVVPIKDVKTLLKACALVARDLPAAEFWIVGPTDEDEVYHRECLELVELLGLRGARFTGPKDVKTVYPEIDVLALTSVSEGQPLTILEAGCAGVPVVATDVGACRELLEGRTPEDRALGPGGLVTGIGDPEATARALLQILRDGPLRARLAQASRARVAQFYQQSQVIDSYRDLYRTHVEA